MKFSLILAALLISSVACKETGSESATSLDQGQSESQGSPTSPSSGTGTVVTSGSAAGGASTGGGATGGTVDPVAPACPAPAGQLRVVSDNLIKDNTSEAIFGAKVGGEHHVFSIYSSALAPLVNSQLAHFNLDTKEVNVVTGLPGRHNLNSIWLNGGKIYFNSYTPLFAGVYDITAKTFTNFGAPGLNATDRVGKTFISNGGAAFITTTTRGNLAKFDLTTSTLQKTQILDLPNWYVGASSLDVQLLNIKVEKNLTTGEHYGIIQLAAPIATAPLKIKIENSAAGVIDGVYEYIKSSFSTTKTSFKVKMIGKDLGTYDNAGLKLVNHECYGCNRSIDTAEADTQNVYMPIRNVATGKYWLIIRSTNMANPMEVSCFYDSKKSSLSVLRSATGQIYFKINGLFYQANGSNCPVTQITTKMSVVPSGQNKNFSTNEIFYNLKIAAGYNAWKAATGMILNFEKFAPNTFTDSSSILSFLASNSSNNIYESIYAKDINLHALKPAQFSYIEPINKILVGVGGFSRFFMIDPITSEKTDLGNMLTLNPYDITQFNNFVYLTGNLSKTFRYDVSKVWTLSSLNSSVLCQSTNPPNPCLLSPGLANTHSYGRVDQNGKLFVLGNYSKEAYLGGEVGWDDGQSPFSNYREKLEADDLVPETSCYTLSQLMRLKDGKQLVFQGTYLAGTATNHTCPNDPAIPKTKIFFFDTVTKMVTHSFPLDRSFLTLTPINDNFVWGVKITNEKVGFQTYEVAKINLTDGSIYRLV
jgi:hypothetical protein